MKPQPKEKIIRLKGQAYRKLQRQVLERDEFRCQTCGKYVEDGVPPHHVRYRSQGGSDTMENLKTLCMKCHEKTHHR